AVHLGGEVARGNGVDLNVEPRQICGHALGEHGDTALSGRVRGNRLAREHGLYRTDIDDLAGLAPGHPTGDLVGDVERAGEVGRYNGVPVGGVELGKRGPA